MTLRIEPSRVPEEPGVYLFKDPSGEILYVGKAGNLRARLSQYRAGEVEARKESMLERAASYDLLLTRSEKEALLLESALIKRHRPRYNVRLTDDRRYPYIRLSADPYPGVSIVRDTRGPGSFFGPFPDAGAARRTVQVLREVFRVRDCKELLPGGCLNYQMGLCWAPCIHDREERLRKAPRPDLALVDVDATYEKAADEAGSFLRGDAARLSKKLEREMEEAAGRLDFERAATLRDRLQGITTTLERQAVFRRGAADRDAFVVHREGPLAVGFVVLLRGGDVAGEEHFFFRRGAAEREVPDLLAEFIERYYEHLPNAPAEILLPETPANAEGLAALLAEKRGSPVSLRVPQRGADRQILDLALKNAKFRLGSERLRRGERDGAEEVDALAKALGLAEPPSRIDCFDVSHLGGTGVVASMSVLVGGRPARAEYRRFKIRLDRNDDFAAMHEVVSRRFARALKEGAELPGLVLIDGGPGQLSAAKSALDDLGLGTLPLASLAKREEEVYTPGSPDPLRLPRSSPALILLMRARDEAHRFAVDYQRRTRKAGLTRSWLDDVAGLGPVKKRALLARYGSPEGVARAPVAEVARVPGIGVELARRIAAAGGRSED